MRAKNKGDLRITKLSELSNERDGVPIFADKKGGDVRIVLADPIHTLIIGTTGSGKTTGYIEPVIQILSRTKTRPSLVLTDPKGELYISHALSLQKQGYKVLLLDLVNVYHSMKWNPFYDIIRKTDIINEIASASHKINHDAD